MPKSTPPFNSLASSKPPPRPHKPSEQRQFQPIHSTQLGWCCKVSSKFLLYFSSAISIFALIVLTHIFTIPVRITYRYYASDYGRNQVLNLDRSEIVPDLTTQQWFGLPFIHTQPLPPPAAISSSPIDLIDLSSSQQPPATPTNPLSTTALDMIMFGNKYTKLSRHEQRVKQREEGRFDKSDFKPHLRTPIASSTTRTSFDSTPYQHHPFFIPHRPLISEPVPVSPDVYTFNLSVQPLPPNPQKYKYFMTRRLVVDHPLPWQQAFKDLESMHHGISSCFSDYFPSAIVNRMRDELRKGKGPDDDEVVVDVINIQLLDLDELASYYGYSRYDDMPYHPKIPLHSRYYPEENSDGSGYEIDRWEHHCITPWKDDLTHSQDQQPSYYKQFFPHRGYGYTGPEDNRVWYDRCGRLMSIFGKHNDQTPIAPNWAQFVMDSRLLEPEGLLIKPLEFCHVEYQNRTMTHLIRNSFDGHSELWEKNHHELPYGFGLADMASMVALRNIFKNAASYYDYRTNSFYLTQRAYNEIKEQFFPLSDRPHPPTTSPSTSQNPLLDYVTSNPVYSRSIFPFKLVQGSIKLEERELVYTERKDYQATRDIRAAFTKDRETYEESCSRSSSDRIPSTPTYPTQTPTGLNPERYHNDVQQVEDRFAHIPKDRKVGQFAECLLKYDSLRSGSRMDSEAGVEYLVKTVHQATNHILLRLRDKEDWGFGLHQDDWNAGQPSSSSSSSSIYEQSDPATESFSFQTDSRFRADDEFSPPNLPPQQSQFPSWVYVSIHHERSIWGNYRAVLLFVNALTLDLIAIQPIHWDTEIKCRMTNCEYGIGPKCGKCSFIYTNGLFVNTTPLSFAIMKEEDEVDETARPHTRDPHISPIDFKHTTKQSLHTVLPTFHTLESQWFVMLNQDDRLGWTQELNLKSIWHNRFNCMSPPVEEGSIKNTKGKKAPINQANYIPIRTEFHRQSEKQRPSDKHKHFIQQSAVLTPQMTDFFSPQFSKELQSLRQAHQAHLHDRSQNNPTSLNTFAEWSKVDWSRDDWFQIAATPYENPRLLFFFLPRVFEFYNWDLHWDILIITFSSCLGVWVLTVLIYLWYRSWVFVSSPTESSTSFINTDSNINNTHSIDQLFNRNDGRHRVLSFDDEDEPLSEDENLDEHQTLLD